MKIFFRRLFCKHDINKNNLMQICTKCGFYERKYNINKNYNIKISNLITNILTIKVFNF